MSRKVPTVSATNYASIFTAPVFKDPNGEWYRDVGYEDSLDIIRDNFLSAGKSFVAIGYYLKHIKEKELYKEGGYANIWECARMEFGLSDTAASNYMKMNDAYSVNGDTPILDEKYGGFNKSQLQEMLALTTEKREGIAPEQTVSEIREIAKEEKRSKEPVEEEIRIFYDGYVKDMDDGPRSTLKERLRERYRHTYVACPDEIRWEGSARGICINGAEEITWAQLVKLIDRYIPQDKAGEQASDVVEGQESGPQIPGQMKIEDYPEALPESTEEQKKCMPGESFISEEPVRKEIMEPVPKDSALPEKENLIFSSDAHEKFYYEKLKEARNQDVYHKALVYCLGISSDTRRNVYHIYNFKDGSVKTECLHEGWQGSGSMKVVRLAFNLYCNSAPSISDYEDAEGQVDECCQYTVENIFCCPYAPYFWQAIKIRYPEYADSRME